MIHQLQEMHELFSANPQAVFDAVLPHLKLWVASLRTCLAGEYPHFEIMQAYQVFSVASENPRPTSAASNRDRSTASDEKCRLCLRRLGAFYDVDSNKDIDQYFKLRHLPPVLLKEEPSFSAFQAFAARVRGHIDGVPISKSKTEMEFATSPISPYPSPSPRG